MNGVRGGTLGPLAVLRRSLQPSSRLQGCELCGEELAGAHRHVVDLDSQRLLCTCHGCGLLFSPQRGANRRYRAVGDRYLEVAKGQEVAKIWESLAVPVGVVFFVVSSRTGRASAFYPGPAGVTQSSVDVGPWPGALAGLSAAAAAEPDVEAVLLRVSADIQQAACYIVPVDACYELSGRMRQLWRGFDGGAQARKALDEFFVEVQARCQ